jgi:AcrR family transcriptional regulator
MSKPAPKDLRDGIVDAMLRLAADRPFADISMSDIAAEAGIDLARFRDAFPSKGAVLGAFSRRIDQSVLASLNDDLADENDKERLFDILMRRIDAMAPYKDAIRSIADWAKRDPLSAAALNSISLNGLRFMVEAAGVRNDGLFGHLKLQGLVILWTRVLAVWLKDEEEGWPATMAELDRGLARGQFLIARAEDAHRISAPLRGMARQIVGAGARMRQRAARRASSEPMDAER